MTAAEKDRVVAVSSVLGFAIYWCGVRCQKVVLQFVGLILLLPMLLAYWALPVVLLWRRYGSGRTWWPDRVIPRLFLAHCVACIVFYPLTVDVLPLVNSALKGNVMLEMPQTFIRAVIWAPVGTPRSLAGITLVYGPYWWLQPILWVWPAYLLPATVVFVTLSMPDWRRAKYARRRAMGLCMRCGYDLRASKERCPECGTVIAEKDV